VLPLILKSPALCPVQAARNYITSLHRASATNDTFVLQSVLVNRDGCSFSGAQLLVQFW
jgi:hypothetical protein